MGLAHGLFVVPVWKVQRRLWLVEVAQSNPYKFVFVLEQLIGHARVVSLVKLGNGLGPFASVPEGLDPL